MTKDKNNNFSNDPIFEKNKKLKNIFLKNSYLHIAIIGIISILLKLYYVNFEIYWYEIVIGIIEILIIGTKITASSNSGKKAGIMIGAVNIAIIANPIAVIMVRILIFLVEFPLASCGIVYWLTTSGKITSIFNIWIAKK